MRKMNKSLVLLLLSLLGSCESMTYGVENSANIKKSVSSEVSDKLNDLSLKANLSNKKESKGNSKKNNSELNKINSSNKKLSKTKLALGIGIPAAAVLGLGTWAFVSMIDEDLDLTYNPKRRGPSYNGIKTDPSKDNFKSPIQKNEKYNYKTVFEDFMNTRNSIDEDNKEIFKTVLVKSPAGLNLNMGDDNDITLNDIDYSINFSKNADDYNDDFKDFCSRLEMEFTLGEDGVFELNKLLKELSKFETKQRKPKEIKAYNLRQWVFNSKNWSCMLFKVKGDDNFYGAFAKGRILLPFIIKKNRLNSNIAT